MASEFTVKLGLDGLTSVEVVEACRARANAIAANPGTFVNPTPLPAAVLGKCIEVEKADIGVTTNGGKQDYLTRNQRLKELKLMNRDMGGYVQAISNGDPEIITLAAFPMRKSRQPSPLPDAPQNLLVRITTKPGELRAHWDASRNRLVYRFEVNEGDTQVEANWTQVAIVGKNFFLMTGLTSHKLYSFRVAAVGAAGTSAYSDIATAKPL